MLDKQKLRKLIARLNILKTEEQISLACFYIVEEIESKDFKFLENFKCKDAELQEDYNQLVNDVRSLEKENLYSENGLTLLGKIKDIIRLQLRNNGSKPLTTVYDCDEFFVLNYFLCGIFYTRIKKQIGINGAFGVIVKENDFLMFFESLDDDYKNQIKKELKNI